MRNTGNDYYVGTMTVMFSIEQLLRLPADGLCQGAVPIMSYNYGAGKPERVKKTFSSFWPFLRLYHHRKLAHPALSQDLHHAVHRFPAAHRNHHPRHTHILRGHDVHRRPLRLPTTFMALGRTKLSLLGAMMRKHVILLPLCFILPRLGYGTDGLLYAECIADVLGSAIVFAIFIWNFKSMLKTP